MINPNNLRKHVLKMVYEKQSGHIGGSFSLAELISVLYTKYDLISDEIDSAKLVLSKGHAVPILYAVLYELGLLTDAELTTFREVNSVLQGHPDKCRLKYMHATTGSLGQGLSISIGYALGMKLKKINQPTFCILGDGEMQEGQIWEALMLAPKFSLDNLICFIDCNGSQNDGMVNDILSLNPLNEKILSFGWNVLTVDGHNINLLETSIDSSFNHKNGKPTCIILNTKKGHGVSFMNHPDWHAKAPNKAEYEKALQELK